MIVCVIDEALALASKTFFFWENLPALVVMACP